MEYYLIEIWRDGIYYDTIGEFAMHDELMEFIADNKPDAGEEYRIKYVTEIYI